METKKIDGVLYKLVPKEREKSCSGCVFKGPNGAICTILTEDCNRGLIYKKVDEPISNSRLKPFNLAAAKAGKPVYTRDGRKARIICFDRNWDMNIIALVSDPLGESVHYYLSNGKVDFYKENDEDLLMLPEKKEGWINIYKGDDKRIAITSSAYATQEEALDKIDEVLEATYITTNKIEWEE